LIKRVASSETIAAPAAAGGLLVASLAWGRHPWDWAMPDSPLRAILDTAVDGIILMDADGMVTMFNAACERMFGYPATDIVGLDVKRLMHGQYLRETGQPEIIGVAREVVGLRRNGDTFPMDLTVGAGRSGGEVFYVGIVRDVSERKRAEALQEQFFAQLTASNIEAANFAHVASHDLREPLRMVGAFCGLLSKNYGDRLDDHGREYLSLTITATTQMRALLDDLVDFGRLGLEAERGSWFSADECLGHVLETLQEPMRESGAEISRDVLPEIFGNPIRFQRLMQNLIGNALKYVSAGVVPRIRISAAREGDFWRFSVADNGIGIEPHHHLQIFEPFKRLHSKSAYYGTGLGLAICQRIVEGFGGALGVRSAAGKGSTFSFTVKIQPKEGGVAHADD
jgi:PAS domain S-box-containing protein